MKVFFTASKRGQKPITDFLKYEGYELLRKDASTLPHADLCIFECSNENTTVGYLVLKALELEKPVIVLYTKNHKPEAFNNINNDKFQLVEYANANVFEKLKAAVNKASFLADKRFNFFVSSSMLAYLNAVSKKLGVTKSTFIRNLIEEYKRKNS